MKEVIEKCLEEFEKLFGEEAKVEIKEIKENEIRARFFGHMCYTCGAQDYFDDFAQILSEFLGEKWVVEDYENLEDEYLVTFKPASIAKEKERKVKFIFYDSSTTSASKI
ncbi:MAG: hypothetical protein QXQ14_03050 [Candidatus Aenigmatarchaeota archaeon]